MDLAEAIAKRKLRQQSREKPQAQAGELAADQRAGHVRKGSGKESVETGLSIEDKQRIAAQAYGEHRAEFRQVHMDVANLVSKKMSGASKHRFDATRRRALGFKEVKRAGIPRKIWRGIQRKHEQKLEKLASEEEGMHGVEHKGAAQELARLKRYRKRMNEKERRKVRGISLSEGKFSHGQLKVRLKDHSKYLKKRTK